MPCLHEVYVGPWDHLDNNVKGPRQGIVQKHKFAMSNLATVKKHSKSSDQKKKTKE